MSAEAHPGRSTEFLSRLHDGELSAAERARFESHRAHCAECRHAAAEFEAALSMYRSAPTSPASPDLAARILRRLQTATPRRRRPFGIFYGIDLRWAGAFAAALVAMIIGSAVVLRQEDRRPAAAPATPIPVQLRKVEEGEKAASAEGVRALPGDRARADDAPLRNEAGPETRESKVVLGHANAIPAREAELEKQKDLAQAQVQAPAAPAPAVAADAVKERDANARAAAAPPPAVSGRLASRDDPSGGERSTAAAQELAFAEDRVPVRLEVTALDGEGRPPATLVPPELSAEHRGRAFVVVVSASGQVLEAFPHAEIARRREQEESANAKRQKLDKDEAPDGLTRMVFEAGSRPRRLLVTVR